MPYNLVELVNIKLPIMPINIYTRYSNIIETNNTYLNLNYFSISYRTSDTTELTSYENKAMPKNVGIYE
jgi:hypothetical protein